MRLLLASIVFLLAAALTAAPVISCSSGDRSGVSTAAVDIPKEQPGIRGLITKSDLTDDGGAILVEEDRAGAAGQQKASVRVTGQTRIYRRTGPGLEQAERSALTVGKPVTVWFDGPVAESYPVQGTAAVIVVGT